MFSTDSFAQYALWGVIATLVLAAFTALALALTWGFRFRLVGVTGFMGVLTFGLFALSLTPLTRVSVPNSGPYSLVFDDGANIMVITVAPDTTPDTLAATLEQASYDLISGGRLGQGGSRMTVRARTMLHPQVGVSEPLWLGEASRSLVSRDQPDFQIKVFDQAFKRLPSAV